MRSRAGRRPGSSFIRAATDSTGPARTGTAKLRLAGAVYLKRHFRLPWNAGVAALVDPAGRHSPGAAEWAHLERARELGVPVPDVVATGERIGPWASLQSYLMVAELTGFQELNVALPDWRPSSTRRRSRSLKRRLVIEMARITATLHRARAFHKDLYLCHFYLDRERLRRRPGATSGSPSSTSTAWASIGSGPIAGGGRTWDSSSSRPRASPGSTTGTSRGSGSTIAAGSPMRWPRWQARMITLKAQRYLEHNRETG